MTTPHHTEKAAGRFLHNDSTIKQRRQVKTGPLTYLSVCLHPSYTVAKHCDREAHRRVSSVTSYTPTPPPPSCVMHGHCENKAVLYIACSGCYAMFWIRLRLNFDRTRKLKLLSKILFFYDTYFDDLRFDLAWIKLHPLVNVVIVVKSKGFAIKLCCVIALLRTIKGSPEVTGEMLETNIVSTKHWPQKPNSSYSHDKKCFMYNGRNAELPFHMLQLTASSHALLKCVPFAESGQFHLT